MHIMGTGKNGNYKKTVKRYKKSKDPVAYARGIGVSARVICKTEEYAEKCLRSTPEYDVEAYKKDQKSEVLKMWGINNASGIQF